MRKWTVLFTTIFFVVAVVGIYAAYSQDPMAEIDAVYAKRNGTGQFAKQALKMAEDSFANGGGFEAAWRAARSCFWVCDRTLDSKVDLEYGKKGWDWGLKAIELNPNRVEGHYFACICAGEYGTGMGIAKAIYKGMGSKYEKHGNDAIRINANYERGGPLRAMGRYFQVLPKLVRKLDKAEDYLKKSEQVAPCMTRSRFYLVELYMEKEDWAKARATADAALQTPGCPEHAWECSYYKQEIKKLMAKFPAQ